MNTYPVLMLTGPFDGQIFQVPEGMGVVQVADAAGIRFEVRVAYVIDTGKYIAHWTNRRIV